MVDLDGTVDEVKQQIRDAEDPDYSELLEQEKEGKDRKTIKEFLQKRIDNSEDEVEDIQEEMSDEQEEVEEELVEEIEQDTEGGLFAGFTSPQLLTGGALLGLVIGLVVGAVALPMNQQGVSPDQAEQKVSTLLAAGGQLTADQISIDTSRRNGMYYMNVTAQVQGVNGTTRTQSQAYYMSTNGQLMFPEQIRTPFGAQRVAIDVDQAIAQAQQPSQPRQPANQTQQQPSRNQTQ